MSTTPFIEEYADVPVKKIAGDDFHMHISYNSSVAGHTFEAGVTTPINGEVIAIISVTVLDAGTGSILLSLTKDQTSVLADKSMSWYYARTANGIKRTELGGKFEMRRR